MDRFYDILSKSVAASRPDDPDARAAIYDQARRQLARLIADAEPRMPAETEFAYRSDLEQAITRLEAEFAGAGTTANPTSAAVAEAIADGGPQTDAPVAPPPSPTIAPRRDRKVEPDAGNWTRRRRLSPRMRRVAIVSGFALFAIAAICFGIWMLLASIFAPEVPTMDAIARRLKSNGAAVVFVGAGAERIKSGAGTRVSNVNELFGQGAVRVRSRATGDTGEPGGGARIVLPREIRPLLNDATLRVVIIARADPGNPSPEFALDVADGDATESGWQHFPVDDSFQTYTFEYAFDAALPAQPTTISILADSAEKGRGIEIREISLGIVPN